MPKLLYLKETENDICCVCKNDGLLLGRRFSLGLLLLLLLFENLALAGGRLAGGLDTLGSLARLVHLAALHDAVDDLPRVDVRELVLTDLAVDAERLGGGVGVVGEGHELCRAVVDGVWCAPGKVGKVGLCGGEGGAEDDGVDVLAELAWQ